MTIDLRRARDDTPGCEHVLHFNNAGAALMPKPVIDAGIGHLRLESAIGGYEAVALCLPRRLCRSSRDWFTATQSQQEMDHVPACRPGADPYPRTTRPH